MGKQPKSKNRRSRFRILVCIDGSEESYSGLRYAARIGSGTDADVTLLFIRPVDQGLRTGGLQLSVARQNMLDWGLELPGMKALKKGRDLLIELLFLGEDWTEKTTHTDIQGDPLGDNLVEYTSNEGQQIVLKLLVSPSVDRGILDECEVGDYDITIISMASAEGSTGDFIDAGIAETVAIEHHGTVLVVRALEESHGHLICVKESRLSQAAAVKDAGIASRCACPVFLFSVAPTEKERKTAERAVAKAKKAIEKTGVAVAGTEVAIGDPVEKIVETGKKYSLIVLSASEVSGLRRFFTTGVAYRVLRKAHNSVMIVR